MRVITRTLPLDTKGLEERILSCANKLKKEYAAAIAADARAFKKLTVSFWRQALSPGGGRPLKPEITEALRLRRAGVPWKDIYSRVIPGHEKLAPGDRRWRERQLRDSVKRRIRSEREKARPVKPTIKKHVPDLPILT